MKGVIEILTATLPDGTPVVLNETHQREHLRAWRLTEQFACPQCGERVLLKVGSVRIPHFSHVSDSTCSANFSEGESQPHLQGKQLLHSMFQRLNKLPVLEPFIPELAQRPDLLIEHDGRSIPIEFQCSRLPEDVKAGRTIGYQSIGIEPVWILHTPNKYRDLPEGLNVYSFTAFQQLFFSEELSPERTLLTLSPETKQFHYFSHLLPLEGNRFIGIHRKLSISLQIFPFARPKLPDDQLIQIYCKFYKYHRKTYLERVLFLNRKGVQNPFLKACYEMKMRPTELPAWIGVPVKYNGAFTVPDCEWQLGIIYMLKRFGFSSSRVPIQRLRRFIHSYPGYKEDQLLACTEYLHFLQRINWKKKDFLSNERIELEILNLLLDRFLALQMEN